MAAKGSKAIVKSTVEIMKERAVKRSRQLKKAKVNLKKAVAARNAKLASKKATDDKLAKLLGPKRFSAEELKEFRAIILEKRKETVEELDTLKESMMDVTTGEYVSESSTYSLHMEQGTDAMEREKTFLFASRGSKFVNQRTAFVALPTAQALLGLPGGVSAIDVTVRDIYAAEDTAQLIRAATGVDADSWIKTNAQLFLAINAQIIANTTIRFFVGLAVAFGIAAVLIVSVVQKSREIGILRAMGASRGQILRVFLLQGAALGALGSLAGCALGAAAIVLWGELVRNPDGTPLFPLVLDPRLFTAAALLATLTGLVAAFVPAWRGSRMDPVVAIRG